MIPYKTHDDHPQIQGVFNPKMITMSMCGVKKLVKMESIKRQETLSYLDLFSWWCFAWKTTSKAYDDEVFLVAGYLMGWLETLKHERIDVLPYWGGWVF